MLSMAILQPTGISQKSKDKMQNQEMIPGSFGKLLLKYARPFWKHIIALILLTLSANFLATLQPVIISGVINVILDKQGVGAQTSILNSPVHASGAANNVFNLNRLGARVTELVAVFLGKAGGNIWDYLKLMSGIFLLIVLLSGILNYLALVDTRWIRTRSSRLISVDILSHLLSLDLGFFHRQKSGELISRITQDATNISQGLGPLVRSFISNSILILIYSIYLFSTSVWLTFGALVMILLQFGLTHIIKGPIRKVVRKLYDSMANLTTTLQEMFTSIRVIKSFGAENYELKEIERDIDRVRKADFKEGLVRQIEPYAREFLDSIATIGIFLIATVQLLQGSLSIQGFLLFIFVGRLLISPINQFAVTMTWAQAIMGSYERLHELFQERPKVKEGNLAKIDFKDQIVLRNVSFGYEAGGDFRISDIYLTLKKGEVLALVGSSGSGKSTLTDLILRFYDPQAGDILIDGVDLRGLKVTPYRRIFGVVPQESLLFNDTVSNNIRYGREGITQDDIVRAATIANAHDFILELRDGYNTEVGDRGVRLSGGQRQRIAIARAIVASPEILIFDEATSSLDTESEKQVQDAIDNVLDNCTAIAIAHRISTILHADKIAVLNKGRLEAVGKHEELLEKCSTYRRLYELQFQDLKKQNDIE